MKPQEKIPHKFKIIFKIQILACAFWGIRRE